MLVLFALFIFIEKAHNYSLLFPTKNISNYVVLNVNLKAMDTFTACLWVKTIAGGMQTLFSYETALYLQCSDTGECVNNNNNNLLIGCSITRVVYIEVLITRCILYNTIKI